MKIFLNKISKFLPVLLIVVTLVTALPQNAYAQLREPPDSITDPNTGVTVNVKQAIANQEKKNTECGWTNMKQCLIDVMLFLPGWGFILVLKITSWLTHFAGTTLNFVVQYTVVNMKTNLDENVIFDTWSEIRNIANMGFIFILLYAAIKTIIGQGGDNKKLIVNVVVVAILINFSLFFTRVVIDASNILAITFYDAIAPGALNVGATQGLSNPLMASLKIQGIWQGIDTFWDGDRLVVIGIMGTIVTLLAAFIFFAISILFIIRFVVLIFVMILSPIAALGFVLPQAQGLRKDWTNALIGQAFFAPIYFMLTWVVISMSKGLLKTPGTMANAILGVDATGGAYTAPPYSSLGIFVNFAIMIGLLIASLVVSKNWANKTPLGFNKISNWATGVAGGATLGLAGRLGRNTIGRAATAVGDSERLKDTASKGGFSGAAARLTLAAGRKTSKSSFDVRGTPLGGQLDAGKAQKGGFDQTLKDKTKKEKDFAESLKPSDALVAERERVMEKAKTTYGATSREFIDARNEVDRLKGVDENEAIKRVKDEAKKAGKEMSKDEALEKINEDREKFIIKGVKDQRKEDRIVSIEKSPTFRVANAVQGITDNTPEILRWTGARNIPTLIRFKNRAAVAEIRKGKKPVKDQLEEILKAEGDIKGDDGKKDEKKDAGEGKPAEGGEAKKA